MAAFYAGETQTGDAPRRGGRFAALLLLPLAVVLAVLLVVFFGAFRTFAVDGESMLPNLLPGDRLLVTNGYLDARQGDVVVVVSNSASRDRNELVKRVIALPGQKIEVRDDVAYVDGIAESGFAVLRSPGYTSPPYVVPAGTVFVLGDNRPISNDSRYIGPIELSGVTGRAVAVFAPVGRIGSIPRIASAR